MEKLLSLKYWLNSRPQSLSPAALKYFVAFIAILAISAFIFYLIKTRKKSIYTRNWNKLYVFFITNFILGIMFLFFAYELIPFLSTRILMALWWLSMFTWLTFILRSFLEIPKIKQNKQKEDAFKKYIP